jgi:inorganic phosphate transporter, PiT family
MVVLLFISGGLFLGWSLGANDAANIFGTAVGTKMIKFRSAALISGIFVILGAVIQGQGGAETLNRLGMVDALGGAFTIALCSGLTVFGLAYYNFPVSTTQATVGAILGWCFFTNHPADYHVLKTVISSWFSGPLLGAIITPLLYLLLRFYLRKSRMHIIKLDYYIRIALIVTCAFGAYSLGANNIANVIGVFITSIPEIRFNLGIITISSMQLLLFLSGLSVAIGIMTYGRRVMETVRNGIMSLTPEASIVVVLAQALILLLFSSVTISNFLVSLGLPEIPQVPISSTQVVVGSVLGISLVKGVSEVKFKLPGIIMFGWVLTPILSCLLTFFSLFIVQNVFNIIVTNKTEPASAIAGAIAPQNTTQIIQMPLTENMTIPLLVLTFLIIITVVLYFDYRKHKLNLESQNEKSKEASKYNEMHKALTDIEVKTIQLENTSLSSRLTEKRNEVVNYALNISEQRKFLETLRQKIESGHKEEDGLRKNEILKEVLASLHQKMSFSNEMEDLYLKAEKVHNDFPNRIHEKYPNLTDQEKRLTILLRIGFSSKEISSLMNISPKSVEISRYRLRKKLNISKKTSLTQFIKNI